MSRRLVVTGGPESEAEAALGGVGSSAASGASGLSCKAWGFLASRWALLQAVGLSFKPWGVEAFWQGAGFSCKPLGSLASRGALLQATGLSCKPRSDTLSNRGAVAQVAGLTCLQAVGLCRGAHLPATGFPVNRGALLQAMGLSCKPRALFKPAQAGSVSSRVWGPDRPTYDGPAGKRGPLRLGCSSPAAHGASRWRLEGNACLAFDTPVTAPRNTTKPHALQRTLQEPRAPFALLRLFPTSASFSTTAWLAVPLRHAVGL
jgi:hypothetical protein